MPARHRRPPIVARALARRQHRQLSPTIYRQAATTTTIKPTIQFARAAIFNSIAIYHQPTRQPSPLFNQPLTIAAIHCHFTSLSPIIARHSTPPRHCRQPASPPSPLLPIALAIAQACQAYHHRHRPSPRLKHPQSPSPIASFIASSPAHCRPIGARAQQSLSLSNHRLRRVSSHYRLSSR